ncbi:MAG TPA: DUF1566 domain-containing protein [Bacteroidia bacterium]|nr:DUF1566 domain-containing protein [Bacteroidia bacterium]
MKNNILKKISILLFACLAFSFSIKAQYKIGDKLDSGIVYWVDKTGQHGLIAAPKDCGKMNWADAVKACAALGNGWHLPTKDELDKLYKKEDKVGGFSGAHYWASEEYSHGSACYQDFESGIQAANDQKSKHDVRAVKVF